MYTYGSLFTGIGGIDLGLEKAGFECQWMVESDPTCIRVMNHHWPKVPKFGDVKNVKGKDLEEVDLIVGGWPCQDLSVAGLRSGLAGQRSGLFFEFMRLVDELSPSWVLAENVPGLLSAGCKPACPGGCVKSHGGAMGTVIGALADRGYGYAWRVLDAQYLGLAQRRKRVFLVGHLGEPWSAPAQVLFEPDSLRGDPPSRPAKRENSPGRVEGGAGSGDLESVSTTLGGGHKGHDLDRIGSLIHVDVVKALTANGVGTCGPDDNQAQAGHFVGYPEPARTVIASARGQRYDYESETFAYSVYPESGQGADIVAREVDVAPALTRTGIADQTDRGTFIARTYRKVHRAQSDSDVETWAEDDVANTLNVHDVGDVFSTNVVREQEPGVRRLTPLECERLQGFSDGWTDPQDGKKQISDSARYKMIGNAVASPCAEWIGHRLTRVMQQVEEDFG